MKKIQLLGNLGKDATVTQHGENHALNFSIATTERTKVSGVWGDLTTWSNITYWGKKETVDKLSLHLKKGKKVFVEGSFYSTLFKDKIVNHVTAQNLTLC